MAATWDGLKDELKAKIQEMTTTGQFNVQSVTGLDGISHTFYSLPELIEFYNIVASMAQAEEDQGTAPKFRPISFRKGTFNR